MNLSPYDLTYQRTIQNTKYGLLLLLLPLSVWSQSKDELDVRRQKIVKQIELTNQILQETEKNKSKTLDDYKTLRAQIENRETLVENLRSELSLTNTSISSNQTHISQLRDEVNSLKSDYENIMRKAYRDKMTSNLWVQLLSAQSLEDALLKWRYTKQFEEYSAKKANLITEKLKILEHNVQENKRNQSKQQELYDKEQQQQSLLNQELAEVDELYAQLETNASKLNKTLDRHKKDRDNLNNAISNIINLSNTSKTGEKTIINTSELTRGFDNNRGKLPWPVDSGLITQRFGKQSHPIAKNIIVEYNGIDIQTIKGADVYALYEGVVWGTKLIPGYNNLILINHGDYRTVYANIDQVYVKKGDRVKKGQKIGKLVIEEEKSKVHLEIWRGQTKLNPANWITK